MEQEIELKIQTRNEGYKARAWSLETAKEQIWTEMKGKPSNNRLMGLEVGKEQGLAVTQ